MKRRNFIQAAAVSAGTLASSGTLALSEEGMPKKKTRSSLPFSKDPVALVQLTDRIACSRIGLGTGVHGGNRQCNMTRMERKDAINIFRLCYDAGIRLFDLADLYGSHDLAREALAGKPRDSYTIVSKMWEHPNGLPEKERPLADVVVKRFLKELNTDYIDLLQIHCVVNDKWSNPDQFGRQFEALERVKEQGLIRAHGVTCHALTGLRQAAVHPWVDAVHARLNTANTRMDGSWDDNVAALKTAHDNGKGVIIMKVLGEGSIQDPAERKKSTDRVTRLACKDAMVVGFEKPEHITEFMKNISETLENMAQEQSLSL